MSGASYPIGTLFEMAVIPEDALPRFLAELPTILAECRKAMMAHAAFNAAMGDIAQAQFGVPEWIDDDLHQFTSTVTLGDDEVASFTIKRGQA